MVGIRHSHSVSSPVCTLWTLRTCTWLDRTVRPANNKRTGPKFTVYRVLALACARHDPIASHGTPTPRGLRQYAAAVAALPPTPAPKLSRLP